MKKELQVIIESCRYDAEISFAGDRPEKLLNYIEGSPGILLCFLDDAYPYSAFNGIDIARRVREKSRDSYIVYNTAESEYIRLVLKALIRPAGFFDKPIEKAELEVLVGDIYCDYLNLRKIYPAVLNINIGTDIYRLEYDQIMYLEAFGKKVYVYTSNQRIGCYASLASLEDRLGMDFIRCHKSYIVNQRKIARIRFAEMKIEMQNGAEVDISRTYKKIVRERFGV